MMLILHDSTTDLTGLVAKIAEKNTSHVILDVKEIVNNVEIMDEILEGGKSSSVWTFPNQMIRFENVNIYNRLQWLDPALFLDYIPEDRDFVLHEWWAYFVFRINSASNVINKLTNEMLCGQFYNFNYQYKVAEACGIQIPSYIISTNQNELEEYAKKWKNYITRSRLSDNYDFRKKSHIEEDTIALIEALSGHIIMAHMIDDDVFCAQFDSRGHKKEHVLPTVFQDKLQKLKAQYNLRAMEVVLRQDENKGYILQNVSAFPTWDFNTPENTSQIYDRLVEKLK